MRAFVTKQNSNDIVSKKRNPRNIHPSIYSKRAFSSPISSPFIQQKSICPCDGGCPRCLPIQAKLKIGQPNDRYEQEADRVADQVMKMEEPKQSLVNGYWSLVQRQTTCPECKDEEEEKVQPKPIVDQITPLIQRQEEPEEETNMLQEKMNEKTYLKRQEVIPEEELNEEDETIHTKKTTREMLKINPTLESHIHSLKGGGQPLSDSAKNFFEARFNTSLDRVRIHTNSKATGIAEDLNAKAFTYRNNIVFAKGEYSEELSSGKKLIAHELTHVLQNKNGIKCQRRRKSPKIKRIIKKLRESLNVEDHPAERLLKNLPPTPRDLPPTPREKKKIFKLLRRYYRLITDKKKIELGIERTLEPDDRWYARGLLYFGPERVWPIPARYKPPNEVPNTFSKFLKMLRGFSKTEFTPKFQEFTKKVKVIPNEYHYLYKMIEQQPEKGLENWLVTYVTILSKSSRFKGRVCRYLRQFQNQIKDHQKVKNHIRAKLKGDDRWYTLGLLLYGPETNWPIPAKYKSAKKANQDVPNTYKKFVKMLRDIYREKNQPAVKLFPNLGNFINDVFEGWQKKLAFTIFKYAGESHWPAAEKEISKVCPYNKIISAAKRGFSWLTSTIKKLDLFYKKYPLSLDEREQRPVKMALRRNFGEASDNDLNILFILQNLRKIYKDMNKARKGKTADYKWLPSILCYGGKDWMCERGYLAYAHTGSGKAFFCPSFFKQSLSARTETLIHEISHAIFFTKDWAYTHERLYWILTWGNAKTNADSYSNFVMEIATGKPPGRRAQDELEDCKGWENKIKKALALAEYWNLNTRKAISDRRPEWQSKCFWIKLWNKFIGPKTPSSLDRVYKAFDSVYKKLRSSIEIECEQKGRHCERTLHCYWYSPKFLSDFHICLSWLNLPSDEDRAKYMLIGLYGYLSDEGNKSLWNEFADLSMEFTKKYPRKN